MDSRPRHVEDDAERETPADAGACQTCRLTARVAVAMATITLVTAVLLSFVLFVTWTTAAAAPEVDQTSKTSGQELLERLQQCQKERHDLSSMLHTVTQDSRCSLCPDGWRWWRGHCYFFSVGLQENRRWNESAEFCQQHNSSLPVIRDSAEMDFIEGVMRNFSQFSFLWVGLTDTQQEGQWLWLDGTDIQHYMPVTVEWDDDHRDCADLRGGGSLFAVNCAAFGPWACEKEF